MGEASRRRASGHSATPLHPERGVLAQARVGNLKIELFRQGWHLELSRRARNGCGWSHDRLRIVAEAWDATDARPLPCAACNTPTTRGLFHGWAILRDQCTPRDHGRFVPLCPSCAALPWRDAIKRIGKNLYHGFEYGSGAPIE